ncbi:MAG: OmpA family protein [Candidatus Competibacteraceae bacterium]|nr:OmpA family protein [Candidatus Competibacteraceae bacterium]MCB1805741.1 OmpA family protein [Candidatus Competibacteraceae bacterium]MCB1812548.1 OmpA family protein [Candidatus Competibacteraceae bacterium]
MTRVTLQTISLPLLLALAVLLGGCADSPYQRTATGATIGAIAGGVLGHQLDDDAGRYVGAAVGAAIGGGIGYAMDQQAQDLQRLAAENQALGMEVQRLQDGSIRVDLPSEVTFDFNSDRVRPEFAPTLGEMARILNQDPRSTVTIVGHTDSVGSDAYNMDLSLRRARSVAAELNYRGVDRGRLYTEGRGERQPRADNATEQGRRMNRRVEIFIRPIS